MGKGVKEHRIDKRESFRVKETERIIITARKINVSVQATKANKVQIWLYGVSPKNAGFKIISKEDLVIATEEKEEVGNLEMKIAIPENGIKYLSIGTISGNVKVEGLLPKELRIKTKDGEVRIKHAPDKESSVYVSTVKADIRTEFKAACVEVEAKSVSGKFYNSHKTNGNEIVKFQASTISGDIFVL